MLSLHLVDRVRSGELKKNNDSNLAALLMRDAAGTKGFPVFA